MSSTHWVRIWVVHNDDNDSAYDNKKFVQLAEDTITYQKC